MRRWRTYSEESVRKQTPARWVRLPQWPACKAAQVAARVARQRIHPGAPCRLQLGITLCSRAVVLTQGQQSALLAPRQPFKVAASSPCSWHALSAHRAHRTNPVRLRRNTTSCSGSVDM